MRRSSFPRPSWARPFRRRGRPPAARSRGLLSPESLEDRLTPAYGGSFADVLLTVASDGASDTMVLTEDSSGNILLNDFFVSGGPTVSNTNQIIIIGNGGNDAASL